MCTGLVVSLALSIAVLSPAKAVEIAAFACGPNAVGTIYRHKLDDDVRAIFIGMFSLNQNSNK